jgi:ribose/xylose/arabinose/galactoside ABC-type transport system permease subunit
MTPNNITNLLRQGASDGDLAIGATFVIITAGIDLSVGAVVGFSSVIGAWLRPTTSRSGPRSSSRSPWVSASACSTARHRAAGTAAVHHDLATLTALRGSAC